ncbi:MAG: glycosyltransferase family 39 protein, partial [Acidobacteriota bacterium]
MSRTRFAAALAVLACVALAGAERARFGLWTTSDEPPHLAAARAWRYGPGMVSNFEHPVLMKVIAGATLPAAKPDLEIDETRAGRAAIPFVLALLVVATGLLGRAVAGPAAGLAAAAVLAVEPTFRGHGTLVQSDVLVTLFLVAAAFALDKAATPSRPWLVASGVLYGLAMASKYSAFPFLAVFAAVAAIRLATERGREEISSTGKRGTDQRPAARGRNTERATAARRDPPSSPSKKIFSSLFLVLVFIAVPALLTLALVQFLAYAGTTDAAFRQGLRAAFEGLPQEGAVVALAKRFPKWIAGYGAGLLFVQGVAGPGERFNYFFGSVRGTGSLLYFPVALGIKLTAAAVLASLAALAAAVAGLFRGPRLRRLLTARAGLPAALGGAYLAAACVSNVNIGVRHALPCVPFLLVAAAAAAAFLLEERPRVLRAALSAVVLLAAAESALRAGREISFGNFLVGGPAGVPPILSDSNV